MRSYYADRHLAVQKTRGRASEYECIICGCRAQEWAQRHSENGTRPEHYDPMCITCHRHYDAHDMSDSCPYCQTITSESASEIV